MLLLPLPFRFDLALIWNERAPSPSSTHPAESALSGEGSSELRRGREILQRAKI